MNNSISQWRGVGGVFLFFGFIAVLSGKASYTRYGHLEGSGARFVGVIMIFMGIKLIFPKKQKPPMDEDDKE